MDETTFFLGGGGENSDISACVQESSNNFWFANRQSNLWNMRKFQFLLLTYWLESPVFLKVAV
jgi:hypothetical protein